MEKESTPVDMSLSLKNNFIVVNADTDSVSFCKPDGQLFSEEEQNKLLSSLNSLYPEKIKWEHDGVYDCLIVIKSKNYIKLHDGKLEIKGSGLKDPKKQPAIREFMDKVINCLVYDKKDEIVNIYHEYILEAHNVKDISRWCKKMTITEAVLNPKRTNEQKVLDSLQGQKMQMGDKIYVYFKNDNSLGLQENWDNDHNILKMIENIYKGLKTFENVLDMTQFTKFTLKNHDVQVKLAQVLGLPEPIKEKKTRKAKEVVV